MQQKISDQVLISNYLKGNNACLEMLVNRYKDKVLTSILYVVRDSYIAEDIFQETFIKVIKSLKTKGYQDEGKFLPWVLRIARNMCIDYIRKTKRMPVITDSENEDVMRKYQLGISNVQEKRIANETSEWVQRAIAKLPYEQREVLVLRHYGELSFKEIAEVTQVSINTALGRMRYALSNLKKIIEASKETSQVYVNK
jgi:RNA polymerase sigma-70 factor (ECF subfamily)